MNDRRSDFPLRPNGESFRRKANQCTMIAATRSLESLIEHAVDSLDAEEPRRRHLENDEFPLVESLLPRDILEEWDRELEALTRTFHSQNAPHPPAWPKPEDSRDLLKPPTRRTSRTQPTLRRAKARPSAFAPSFGGQAGHPLPILLQRNRIKGWGEGWGEGHALLHPADCVHFSRIQFHQTFSVRTNGRIPATCSGSTMDPRTVACRACRPRGRIGQEGRRCGRRVRRCEWR